MITDIKMCRFENAPWGFRLVGGSDFDYPLTVVKVTEGSIAENAGLQVDDVIVRINDVAATPLAHEDANRLIQKSGNVLYFGVFREKAPETDNDSIKFPICRFENDECTELSLRPFCQVESGHLFVENEFIDSLPDRPCSVLSENTEIKLAEEEIAAVLSGEVEVINANNAKRNSPKPGVCLASDVLRSINEEICKTKAEKEKDKRKWSTFLQKPNRPIPKSKQQLEAELHVANAYKVNIFQKKPTAEAKPETKTETVTEAVVSQSIKLGDAAAESSNLQQQNEVSQKTQAEAVNEVSSSEETDNRSMEAAMELLVKDEAKEESVIADSEIPDLEDIRSEEPKANEETEQENLDDAAKFDKTKATNDNNECLEAADTLAVAESENSLEDASKADNATVACTEATEVEKTEEEIVFEKQLIDVQQQLEALSSLPSTIQSTLDSVTKQLTQLLPTFRLKQNINQDTAETNELGGKEQIGAEEETNLQGNDEQGMKTLEIAENAEERNNQDDQEISNSFETNAELSTCQLDSEQNNADVEELRNAKRQKKYDVIEELEEHLENKVNMKHSKRCFGPLTPSSDRPLVLPGGRRWYRPKDAYNDEFIAETLSAQAELITGSTLGVNFMKYQRPEKHLNFNQSEVYKVIHHLDRQPVRGIEVRPPLVAAEADVRKAIQ